MGQLLELNRASVISGAEAKELDEPLKLEHVVINLKAQLTSDDTALACSFRFGIR